MSHPALARTDHRPWAMPSQRWWGPQVWHDLLFAHWKVPISSVRPLVPAELQIDSWEGETWVGVVPFRMSGVTLRGLPPLPGISSFPELNLRLYVTDGEKRGVWFLSLDAANWLAVQLARRFFYLPYFHARMACVSVGDSIEYESTRYRGRGGGVPGPRFAATYRGIGEPYEAVPGTLEHWLTERYCLYAQSPQGTIYRGEIQHAPWPLQQGQATIDQCEVADNYFDLAWDRPDLLHFAKRLDVVVWPIDACSDRSAAELE